MQGIKSCLNCLHHSDEKQNEPCKTCIGKRYINGPGMPVSFTKWVEDTRVPEPENKINAEDFVRSNPQACTGCGAVPGEFHHPTCTKHDPREFPTEPPRRITASDTQGTGMKYDTGKARLGILLREFAGTLCGIGDVLSFGANKYVEGSWMHVPDAQRRYEDAFLRHLLAIKNGEWLDQESGLPHIDHALTNLMFLRHFYREDKQ